MNIKEYWQSLSNEKKNIYYWIGVVLAIDVAAAAVQLIRFTETGQCRNYIYLGSQLHACSPFEFLKNGMAWISTTNLLMFLPAIVIMVLATRVVDMVFVKKQ